MVLSHLDIAFQKSRGSNRYFLVVENAYTYYLYLGM